MMMQEGAYWLPLAHAFLVYRFMSVAYADDPYLTDGKSADVATRVGADTALHSLSHGLFCLSLRRMFCPVRGTLCGWRKAHTHPLELCEYHCCVLRETGEGSGLESSALLVGNAMHFLVSLSVASLRSGSAEWVFEVTRLGNFTVDEGGDRRAGR